MIFLPAVAAASGSSRPASVAPQPANTNVLANVPTTIPAFHSLPPKVSLPEI